MACVTGAAWVATALGLRGAGADAGALNATPCSSVKCITAVDDAPEGAAVRGATAGDATEAAGDATAAAPGGATPSVATGRTIAEGGSGSTATGPVTACAAFADDASRLSLRLTAAGAKRIAAIAAQAPSAAAARIQIERGRSRTTMTVGSCAVDDGSDGMLTGATEPKLLSAE